MPLTWRERQVLDEIERGLRKDDPRWAGKLSDQSARLSVRIGKTAAYVGIWIGWALMIGGFASARGPISGGFVVGIVGLVLLVASIVKALSLRSRSTPRRRLRFRLRPGS